MANEDHVARLKKGVAAWNAWRARAKEKTSADLPDLSSADLSSADLSHADLHYATLFGAILSHVSLLGADLYGADLRGANLSGADLRHADLSHANLDGADLSGANLMLANPGLADLEGADLSGAKLGETFLPMVDLSKVIGLDTCTHLAPSGIDHTTLEKSPNLPLAFLRGVGLPDSLIDYLPSLLNQPIQFYSCFISYSVKDEDVAERLHADLQNKGVRCWYAPHDLPIGAKILDGIDEAIRLRDKVLLILSEHSIKSDWVEDEVTRAFEEERKRGQLILFPIRLDDTVMTTDEAWAAKLRARHIGDFRHWKDHKKYTKSLERVLRDLSVSVP
jgi:hypothetical protein